MVAKVSLKIIAHFIDKKVINEESREGFNNCI